MEVFILWICNVTKCVMIMKEQFIGIKLHLKIKHLKSGWTYKLQILSLLSMYQMTIPTEQMEAGNLSYCGKEIETRSLRQTISEGYWHISSTECIACFQIGDIFTFAE